MAEPKSEQEFMEQVAAELRGETEASEETREDAFLDDPEAETEAEAETGTGNGSGAARAREAAPDELEQLRAERDELKDRFVRALADAENARKRADRDRKEAENYGGSKLARDLLPVYDNLARALETTDEASQEANKALLEGVELTLRELLSVFRKHGIEPIDPAVGDRFDPQYHEAMFEAPVPGTKAGDIIQVMAKGFLLHDRLLRPAQVGVSSQPAG